MVRTVCEGLVTIHSSRKTMSSLYLIEGIILGAVEEIYEIPKRTSGMG